MTSTQIRQSFLDFFKSKQHTIVPSSSLMPDSPNLLFTNAGMNQFVPIFLGQTKCPYTPGRAADTQKCIRAGGKHNDLDDVGLDTYHHTFFEMLGNWSFGDYFKKEAINWAWELVIEVWKFPPQRIYATIYQPDKSKNDPAERDEEAWGLWAEKFRSVGLDPDIHIVNGNKKDNFWMMGETGPCGPCTEVHVDLRPGPRETDLATQQSGRTLVNGSDARCIEIWNNVFIQYNANPDGTFSPLPAKHVDTGMGFERVTSIIQGTKDLTDFANAKISNYETNIFRPIFDVIENLSGKKYGSTLPRGAHAPSRVPDRALAVGDDARHRASESGAEARLGAVDEASTAAREARALPEQGGASALVAHTEQEKIDVAFRVIADHIRTLSFAIADGIQPGIKGRNGVLRSIHKRMVRYASTIDVKDELLLKTQDALVDVLATTMGDVFPEVRAQKKHIKEVLRQEADVFNKTLERGIERFNVNLVELLGLLLMVHAGELDISSEVRYKEIRSSGAAPISNSGKAKHIEIDVEKDFIPSLKLLGIETPTFPGKFAFELYDTYGFPLDLTELMARERGLTVDKEGFNKLMDEQKKRSQAAQKKEVISLSQIETTTPTKFVGFENLTVPAKVLEVVSLKDKTAVILDTTAAYAEMGGQVGDTGELTSNGQSWRVTNMQKSGDTFLHFIEAQDASDISRGAHAPSRVSDRALAVGTDARPRALSSTTEPKYSRRNLPHFERPWAKYMVTFSTRERRKLTPPERDLVLKSVLYAHEHRQYQLYAACVMPDHVHLLFEPQIKTEDKDGKNVFWSLSEILQGIKSASAHNINKAFNQTGHVWEQESMDRMIRGQSDLEEKFHYICRNPWDAGVVELSENYAWLWTPGALEPRAVARVDAADEASTATREARVLPVPGDVVTISIDPLRRAAIQRHHTVTHLLHWALHEVVSREVSQKGSFVGPDKLTFDFNSAPLTLAQIADIEKLVNEKIIENAPVTWMEVKHNHVKDRKDVMQFFGDKYGEWVRVVQIGGKPTALDGYSMELCGGTHVRATGEIGLFRIIGESAIAAGVRRIEAVAGLTAYDVMKLDRELIKTVAGKMNAPIHELDKKIESLLAHQKVLEKEIQVALQRNASNAASELLGSAQTVNGIPLITHNLGDATGDFLQAIADSLKGQFKGVVVLGGGSENSVTLIATVSPDFTAKVQAGKIIQAIAPVVGGKGGGKPDNARGGGKDAAKLDEALAKAKTLLG